MEKIQLPHNYGSRLQQLWDLNRKKFQPIRSKAKEAGIDFSFFKMWAVFTLPDTRVITTHILNGRTERFDGIGPAMGYMQGYVFKLKYIQ